MEQKLQTIADAISDQTIAITLTNLRDELVETSAALSTVSRNLAFKKHFNQMYPWECYIEIPQFFKATEFLKLLCYHGYLQNFYSTLYTVAHNHLGNLSEKLDAQSLYSVIANCEVVKPFSPDRRRKLTDLVIRCLEGI